MNVEGTWFVEPETNRVVLFRGINLSGGTKLPVNVPSHERKGFWVDYDRAVNFVGRPFPIEEADEHLGRLVDHGFSLLRFMTPWEAIEHDAPGSYDEDYLEYVIALLLKCKKHGLKVYMNPHQDTWSRHCGGSGHPGWTVALAGLDPRHFAATNAAIIHNVYPEPEKFPKMIWHTNYNKLAAATLFTLFFAGKTFAPKCIVNGVHVQDYLQSHYIAAFAELAKRIKDHGLQGSVVIGYDTMNEPGQGYIGLQDITKLKDDDVDFKKGLTPTAFQGMLLGSGFATTVEEWAFTWRGPRKANDVLVDPQGAEAWLSPEDLAAADECFGWKRGAEWRVGCIWANHGVWDPATQTVRRPHYFATDPATGAPASYQTHWLDFITAYSSAVWDIHPDAILFVQPPIMESPPRMPPTLAKKLAYAPHWYDGLTLVKKKWCNYNMDYINLKRGKFGTGPLRFLRALRIGEEAIRQCFVDQIETIKEDGRETIGEYPMILGEIGIPYDMEAAKSSMLQRFWAWIISLFYYGKQVLMSATLPLYIPEAPQNKAMDASINAVEKNLASYTLWNYVPDNHPVWGDLWNGEDLSIWQAVGAGQEPAASLGCTDHVSFESSRDSKDSDVRSDTLFHEELDEKLDSSQNARDIISLHRPHPQKIAGIPVSIQYIPPTHRQQASYSFSYQIRGDRTVEGPTEVYIPSRFFPPPGSDEPAEISISNGHWQAHVPSKRFWVLRWWNDDAEVDETLKLQLTGVKIDRASTLPRFH